MYTSSDMCWYIGICEVTNITHSLHGILHFGLAMMLTHSTWNNSTVVISIKYLLLKTTITMSHKAIDCCN